MPYTTKRLPDGKVAIYKHGKRVATASSMFNAGIYMWKAGQHDTGKKRKGRGR